MDNNWVDFEKLTLADKLSILKRHVKHNSLKKIIQFFIFQRIFRINSNVPWPVHWTSVVSSPKKIKYINWRHFRPNLGQNIGCYIGARNGIEVGVNLRVGPGVKIISANHDVNDYDK